MYCTRSNEDPLPRPAATWRVPACHAATIADLCRAGAIIATLAAAISTVYSMAEAATIQPIDGTLSGGEGSDATTGFENPFNTPILGSAYQQVWNAATIATEPVTITGIAFRLDSSVAAGLDTTLSSIDIILSTTTRTATNITNTFATNRGADAMTVFSGGIGVGPTSGGSPQPFDVAFTFSTPFTYDPLLGNLLLEIAGGVGNALPALDWQENGAQSAQTASLSTIASSNPSAGPKNGQGLIVEFTTDDGGGQEPIPGVPLPGSLPLVLLSMGALGVLHLRGRRDTGRV